MYKWWTVFFLLCITGPKGVFRHVQNSLPAGLKCRFWPGLRRRMVGSWWWRPCVCWRSRHVVCWRRSCWRCWAMNNSCQQMRARKERKKVLLLDPVHGCWCHVLLKRKWEAFAAFVTDDSKREKSKKDMAQLPAYKWAEVYRALRPFLRPFGDSGEGRLDFYHRSLSKAVRKKLVACLLLIHQSHLSALATPDIVCAECCDTVQQLTWSCLTFPLRYFGQGVDEGEAVSKKSQYLWWHRKLSDYFGDVCTNLVRKVEVGREPQQRTVSHCRTGGQTYHQCLPFCSTHDRSCQFIWLQ